MSKKLTYMHACEWRDLNPSIWESWEEYTLNEAKNGRRVSMQYMVEQTRKKDHVNRVGEPVKINNSFCPIFARMLACEHPEAAQFIELRKSEWDEAFPLLAGGVA